MSEISNKENIFRNPVLVIGSNISAFEVVACFSRVGYEILFLRTEASSDTLFPPSDKRVNEILASKNVKIMENATLNKIEGEIGNFYASIKENENTVIVRVSAVVISVDPKILPLEINEQHIGGKVQTLRAFLDDLEEGSINNESIGIWLDRAMPERRDVITAALKGSINNIHNNGKSYIFLQNMPVFGHLGQKTYNEARNVGVQFLRYSENHPVFEERDKKIEVSVQDAVLNKITLQAKIDRLIMPSLILPGEEIATIAKIVKQPLDTEGYLQSGNILYRPVSSVRKGIFYAGHCHYNYDPMDARQEAEAIIIQLSDLLVLESKRNPGAVIEIDKKKCAQCLTCLRVCPHDAIDPSILTTSFNMYSAACVQCGICVSSCPGQAIELKNASKIQFEDAIKDAVNKTVATSPIIVFACQQSAALALKTASQIGLSLPENSIIIEVPCAGRIEENLLLYALVNGAAKVIVAACHYDICRSLKGNILANKRVERVKQFLSSINMSTDLIHFCTIAANEPYRISNLITTITSKTNTKMVSEVA